MQKRLKNVQNVMQQCLSFSNYASNECDQHTFCDDLQDTERRKIQLQALEVISFALKHI